MSKKSRSARTGARATGGKKAPGTKSASGRPVKKHAGSRHATKGPARKKASSRTSTPKGKDPQTAGTKTTAKRAPKTERPKNGPKNGTKVAPAQRRASDPNAVVRQLASYLRFCHETTEKLLNATPDEHALAQLPGADNHKAWTLGHHAVSQAWFASMLTGSMPSVPESYNALFGMNSKPQPDAALYPPLAEIASYWKTTFEALIEAVDALVDDDLAAAPAQDSGGFITSKFDAIAKAAWHDGWHAGQLAALRRGLGLPPALG